MFDLLRDFVDDVVELSVDLGKVGTQVAIVATAPVSIPLIMVSAGVYGLAKGTALQLFGCAPHAPLVVASKSPLRAQLPSDPAQQATYGRAGFARAEQALKAGIPPNVVLRELRRLYKADKNEIPGILQLGHVRLAQAVADGH